MTERGTGKGLGFTINVPLEAGLGDGQYKRAMRDKLLPAAREFRPDLLLVSAGFDAYKHDLLGGMKVTPQGFAELIGMVKAVAGEHCQDRLVAVLEGGYNLEGLADCAEDHVPGADGARRIKSPPEPLRIPLRRAMILASAAVSPGGGRSCTRDVYYPPSSP